MISQRPTDTSRKAFVVDLDGTLLEKNSFNVFFSFSLSVAFSRFRLPTMTSLLFLAACRRLRLTSHRRLKHALLSFATKNFTDNDRKRLAAKLASLINKEVAEAMKQAKKSNKIIVVATAAPAFYVVPLAEAAGADFVVATEFTDRFDQFSEARGEEKKNLVLSLLQREGLTLDSVFTDHKDDLPLLLANDGKNILVNPDPKSLSAIEKAGVKFCLFKNLKNS